VGGGGRVFGGVVGVGEAWLGLFGEGGLLAGHFLINPLQTPQLILILPLPPLQLIQTPTLILTMPPLILHQYPVPIASHRLKRATVTF